MTTPFTKDTRIACSLPPGPYHERLAWIASLNRDALGSYRRDGLWLELTYAAKSIDQVREMVARERDCCAFLAFEMRETSTDITLRIGVPERARESAADLLAPFMPASDAEVSCVSCNGTAT